MRVLLDTNIVLDLLLDRQPWSASLAPLVRATSDGSAAGLDGILTRDPKGFSASTVLVWDPQSFVALL